MAEATRRLWPAAALILVLTAGCASPDLRGRIGANVAAVEVDPPRGGTGNAFYIGHDDSTVYFATASHVIWPDRSVPNPAPPPIELTLPGSSEPVPARVTDLVDYALDVTVIETGSPDGDAFVRYVLGDSDRLERGREVWYVDAGGYAPTVAGRVNAREGNAVVVDRLENVGPGISGSPLFAGDGLVGMIVRDNPVQVTPIREIARLVEAAPGRWRLRPGPSRNGFSLGTGLYTSRLGIGAPLAASLDETVRQLDIVYGREDGVVAPASLAEWTSDGSCASLDYAFKAWENRHRTAGLLVSLGVGLTTLDYALSRRLDYPDPENPLFSWRHDYRSERRLFTAGLRFERRLADRFRLGMHLDLALIRNAYEHAVVQVGDDLPDGAAFLPRSESGTEWEPGFRTGIELAFAPEGSPIGLGMGVDLVGFEAGDAVTADAGTGPLGGLATAAIPTLRLTWRY